MTRQERYVSVDIEAAGPIPGDYSMLSIGACVVGNPETSFGVMLQPISDRFVPEALQVSGLSLDDLRKQGEDPAVAMKRFAGWIETACAKAPPVFVGFNASFDWSFVNWYFHRYLGTNPFGIGALDIKAFYMGLNGCRWDETRSSKLPPELSSVLDHTHDALEDARGQAQLFQLLLDQARS